MEHKTHRQRSVFIQYDLQQMWWEDRWPRNFLPWLISWDFLGVLSCKQNRIYLERYCNKTCNVTEAELGEIKDPTFFYIKQHTPWK